jgi:hypothetical protein
MEYVTCDCNNEYQLIAFAKEDTVSLKKTVLNNYNSLLVNKLAQLNSYDI